VGVEAHDRCWKTVPALSSSPISLALEQLRDLPAGDRALLAGVCPSLAECLQRVPDRRMRFPWQAREFGRTCANCGYVWRVPREFARRRVQSISGFTALRPQMGGTALDPRGLDYPELDAEVQASEEISEEAEAFKSCPRCSSQQFAQRAARPPR
jgi:hypothetical protein